MVLSIGPTYSRGMLPRRPRAELDSRGVVVLLGLGVAVLAYSLAGDARTPASSFYSILVGFAAFVGLITFIRLQRGRADEEPTIEAPGPLALARLLFAIPIAHRARVEAIVRAEAEPFRKLTDLVDVIHAVSSEAESVLGVLSREELSSDPEPTAERALALAERALTDLADRDRVAGDVGFREAVPTHSRIGDGWGVLAIAVVTRGGALPQPPRTWADLRAAVAEILPIDPQATLCLQTRWVPLRPDASFDPEVLRRLFSELAPFE